MEHCVFHILSAEMLFLNKIPSVRFSTGTFHHLCGNLPLGNILQDL